MSIPLAAPVPTSEDLTMFVAPPPSPAPLLKHPCPQLEQLNLEICWSMASLPAAQNLDIPPCVNKCPQNCLLACGKKKMQKHHKKVKLNAAHLFLLLSHFVTCSLPSFSVNKPCSVTLSADWAMPPISAFGHLHENALA